MTQPLCQMCRKPMNTGAIADVDCGGDCAQCVADSGDVTAQAALVTNRLIYTSERLAPWVSASIDDPGTCAEYKAAVVAFLEALEKVLAFDN